MRYAVAFLAVIALVAGVSSATALPPGLVDTAVLKINEPTSLAVAPDGRVFVAEQAGNLRVVKGGQLLATPFVSLAVDHTGERGLLGVAFDPNFLTNHYLYVHYTVPGTPPHNRVSRFTAVGDVAAPGSETVVFDLEPLSDSTNHNGGAIHFGLDGKLYIAVGDNSTSSNAQKLDTTKGKILRLNKDGTIPAANPFYSTASGNNRAIWALGFRNPFTFAVQPGTGRIFVNDVGGNAWEEVDDLVKGDNYGWPPDGPTSDPGIHGPLFYYAHGDTDGTGCAITGGAFYNPGQNQFGGGYTGDYFYGDLCGGWIRRLDASAGYTTSALFQTGANGIVDMAVDSDGSLYYATRGDDALHRITNGAPPTLSGFSPASGVAGTTHVTLTGTNLGSARRVRFNGVAASFRIISSTQLDATVPLGATTGLIRVETPSGWVTSTTPFQVTFTISRFSPTSGPVGTLVNVYGAGFTNPSTVKFNGVKATSVTFVSASRLQATVPAGATTGRISVIRTTAPTTTSSATPFTVTG